MTIRIQSALALPILAILAGQAQAGQSQDIGVAAAVKDDVRGTVEGVTKSLGAGNSLYEDETVATDAKSMAQLIFLDQTSLSVGPQSEVKLDRFVYDPDRKQGDVVLAATKGAFRFITGAQDPRSYKLKTPVATIGVRGTIVDYALESGRLIIRLVEGKAEITLDDGKVMNLTTPGDAIVVLAEGAVIGPAPWSGEIDAAVSGTTFPLYGSQFSGVPHETLDKSTTFNDHTQPSDELATPEATSVSVTQDTPAGSSGTGGGTGNSGGTGASGGGSTSGGTIDPLGGNNGHHHSHHDHGHHFGHFKKNGGEDDGGDF